MPGKDFEQQVRETLGSWRIEPSAGTWSRVEEGLVQKKKRRRAFYFILLAGLLAGGTLLLPEKTLDGPGFTAPSVVSAAQAPKPVLSPADNQGRPSANPHSGMAQLKSTTDPVGNNIPVNSRPEKFKSTSIAGSAVNSWSADRHSPGNPPATSSPSPNNALEQGFTRTRIAENPMPIAENSLTPRTHLSLVSPFFETETITARTTVIHATAQTQTVETTGNTDTYRRKIQWRFGLTAGAGRTAFTQGIGLSRAKLADINAGPTSGSGFPPQGPVYDYRQDPAIGWEAGAWMSRPLSRKWSLTAGVSYLQFNTRTPVGPSFGDSSRSYYNGYASQTSTNSFSTGSQWEYRNRYHIIQLPLSVDWQINKGLKLPISWTIGLTPGYLFSSNALVRDSAQALYSHPDNQRVFQMGIRTGFRFRLLPSSAHPLDIGPVLLYQLNKTFVSVIRDNGHLYYLGLEARLPIYSLSRKQR
jgi:Outer membrane protein beta-barrel domain